MEEQIKIKSEIKEINIDNDKIYLRKSKLGSWKIVHPIKNPDNSINWKNLIAGGNWKNLIMISILVAIILFCLYDWSNAIKTANECLNKTIEVNKDFLK
jgi:hypothetical protein